MTARSHRGFHAERGVGLIEVMISVVIAMLLVLVIYQVYEVSEGQKRTITAGSDAQQNASYGLYVMTRDLSMAGNGIASTAATLYSCVMLRPVPVLIAAGVKATDPDTITVLYGGSSSLSTAVPFVQDSTVQTYVVRGPVAFSPNDVIAAVEGNKCTLSTIDVGGVAVDPATGFATLSLTPVAGDTTATYTGGIASLVNLGPTASMGRIAYTVDPTARSLRTHKQLPADDPVSPVVSDVVNLKAQYGLDTDNDGIVETWQDATGGTWTSATLPNQPLAVLRQIRAVRVAIVTRSTQCEREKVTTGPLRMFENPNDPNDPTTVSMEVEDSDQPCTPRYFRYKVLETVVPLRNALWNPS